MGAAARIRKALASSPEHLNLPRPREKKPRMSGAFHSSGKAGSYWLPTNDSGLT
jgi:hypothetical protein